MPLGWQTALQPLDGHPTMAYHCEAMGNNSFRVLGVVFLSLMLLLFLGAALLSTTHQGEGAIGPLVFVGTLLFVPGLLLLLLWRS